MFKTHYLKLKNIIQLIIIGVFMFSFSGCSIKSNNYLSNSELKEKIVNYVVNKSHILRGKQKWYFHENGNIYNEMTRDYPNKKLEGKYYIDNNSLVFKMPKINPMYNTIPLRRRIIKIGENKFLDCWNDNIDECYNKHYESYKHFKDRYNLPQMTKEEYINYITWNVSGFSKKFDLYDLYPYDYDFTSLKKEDINNSIIVVNSQVLLKDMYLYSYNNNLYGGIAYKSKYIGH